MPRWVRTIGKPSRAAALQLAGEVLGLLVHAGGRAGAAERVRVDAEGHRLEAQPLDGRPEGALVVRRDVTGSRARPGRR